jgi:hypothetical protein
VSPEEGQAGERCSLRMPDRIARCNVPPWRSDDPTGVFLKCVEAR